MPVGIIALRVHVLVSVLQNALLQSSQRAGLLYHAVFKMRLYL